MKHFPAVVFSFLAAFAMAACASHAPPPAAPAAAADPTQELPPLLLTSEHHRLLASISPKPRTALDYYMLLPKSYFSIMPDSRERRVTYIDAKMLSSEYLHALRWFECDGGGFEVTLKLYRTPTRTLVALKSSRVEFISKGGKPPSGEPTVLIERPTLWSYSGNGWAMLPDDSIPRISLHRVLAKYHHDWDADRQNMDQEKSISINYVLDPATSDIVLMGRENFQLGVYEYARLKWHNPRFTFN